MRRAGVSIPFQQRKAALGKSGDFGHSRRNEDRALVYIDQIKSQNAAFIKKFAVRARGASEGLEILQK
jgi:hypothetical protein